MVKLNVANPTTGQQKQVEIEDSRKFLPFVDKRLASEVEADHLGDEWKGYVLKLTGGSDKEGFPMLQGVMTNNRVKLLLTDKSGCYHGLRKGERKRKSVRGCVVSADLAVLNAIVIKKGEKDIAGLTDKPLPQRLGPKRASKIRRLFNLQKQDDLRKYVVTYKRKLPLRKKEDVEEVRKYPRTKCPKIQRLVTPLSLQHKRRRVALRKSRRVKSESDAAEYAKLLETRRKAQREARASLLSTRRSSRKTAEAKPADGAAAKPAADKAAAKKGAAGAAKPAAAKKGAAGAAKPAAAKPAAAKPAAEKPAAAKKGAAGAAKPAAAKQAQGGKK